MKQLPVVILAMLVVLVAVVTGCSRVPHYDSRLAAADSLMRTLPDSALALVEAVSPDSLSSEGDRAYRDLLLTQARYRCYIVATSDSAINRALNYYSNHSNEREKLTRAYIYKGAVMEELGHPDSAMFYYKLAEVAADPGDYFNLGYVNMRIATLYQDHYSQDTAAISHRKKAIDYFELLNDTNYLISCYGDLGALFGTKYPDSAESCLNHAIELARLIHSPKQYTYISGLSGFYFYQYADYSRAKTLAMEVMRDGQECSRDRQFYFYAALSYLRLGMLDSAKYVLAATPTPVDAVDSMNRLHVIAEIAKAEDDMASYAAHLEQSMDHRNQIMTSHLDDKPKVAETDFMRAQAEKREMAINRDRSLLVKTLLVAAILISLLLWLVRHMRIMARKRNEEMIAVKNELNDAIRALQEKQQNLQLEQTSVTELFKYRSDALSELFNSIKFKSKDKQQDKMRSIIPLSSVILGLSNAYSVMKIELSDQFWEKMKRSVDGEYNGIVTFVENNYPELTLKERRLFCLLCANISPQIIRLCLNYTNAGSVSNNRSIIIKKKMGLDMTLEEFREQYMKNEL